MSQESVAEILGRALRDRDFAERLRTQPDAALAEYDLTDEERTAIRRGSSTLPGSATLDKRPGRASRLM